MGKATFTSGAPGAFERRESPRRKRSRLALSALLVSAGILHFVAPRPYYALIPPFLGRPRPWVYGSGIAEIVSGALLAVPRTRKAGAIAATATFIGVFPGNIYTAVSGGLPVDGFLGSPLVAWLRLPLQIPLVLWALAHVRQPRGWRR